MDPVQEIHFDYVLRDSVLKTVKYPTSVAQGHVLLVQLEEKQLFTTPEQELLGQQNNL